jgi:flagellar basal body rod protein FlgB
VDAHHHQISSQNIANINAENFQVIALSMFRKQYEGNLVYKNYVDALKILPTDVTSMEAIPFLPISFFKTHPVVTGSKTTDEATLVFESSGTSATVNSKHYVLRPEIYEAAYLNSFKQFYGAPEDYVFLALLPSYLERKNASLVYMIQGLMKQSNHPSNGFYMNEWAELATRLKALKDERRKLFLIGVTYALLDFAAAYPLYREDVLGMKGRKKEWTRTEVHDFLKQQWQLWAVHSEYGMTELLSQAYAMGDGLFKAAHTMKIMVRDVNDPLDTRETGTGCLNIIDLANEDSCAFIATEDMGCVYADGRFEVLGRMDHSALRGCSLMGDL